jgi:hypothetical protein
MMYSLLSAQQTSRSPSALSSGNVTPELVGYQVRWDIKSFTLRIGCLSETCLSAECCTSCLEEFYFFVERHWLIRFNIHRIDSFVFSMT